MKQNFSSTPLLDCESVRRPHSNNWMCAIYWTRYSKYPAKCVPKYFQKNAFLRGVLYPQDQILRPSAMAPTFWVHPRHLRPRFLDSVNGNVNIATSFFPTKLCIFFIEVSIVIPQIPGNVMAVQKDVQTCTILTLTSWARHITERSQTHMNFFQIYCSIQNWFLSFYI